MRLRGLNRRIIGIGFILLILGVSLIPLQIVNTPSTEFAVTLANSSNYPHIQYQVAQAQGEYSFISVSSDPSGALFTLQRNGANVYGGPTPWSQNYNPTPANYTVLWAYMPGYTAPPPETKYLDTGGSISFYGKYLPGPETNIITITSSPTGASFILDGPIKHSDTTPWQISNAPAGTYTITWLPMPGYLTPLPQTFVMSEGGGWSGGSVYQRPPDSGYISVTSNQPGASFSLIGPVNFNSTAPWNSSAPVGSYTINWNEVSGYIKPPPQTKGVAKDCGTSFYGEYTIAGQLIEYALSIGTNGQGSTSPAAGVRRYGPGTQVSITASASPGWEFSYWGGDAAGTSSSTTVIMDSPKTVIAYFRQASTPTYSLSTSVDPPGSGYIGLNPESGTYAATTPVIVTAYPNQGWTFDHWGGVTDTSTSTTIIMNSNKNITAYFKRLETPAEKYNLSTYVEPLDSGNISPSGGSFDQGAQLTLTANANSGWKFAYWGGAAEGTSNSTTITMSSNRSVTAYFTEISTEKYSLSTYIDPSNSSGYISLSPSGGSYDQGTQVTLTATANLGWEFSYWGGAASGTSTSATIIMSSNKNVTAYFRQKVAPSGCGSSSPLSNFQLADLVRRYFPDGIVPKTGENIRVTAYAVARAESGGNPTACGDGGKAIGLWQIHTGYNPQYDKGRLFDPEYNAEAARQISNNGMNWNPWCTWEQSACGGYGNGTYKYYIDEAKRALTIDSQGKEPSSTASTSQARPEETPIQKATTSIFDGIKNVVNYIRNIFEGNSPTQAGSLSDKVVELAVLQIGNQRGDEDGDPRFKDRVWYNAAEGGRCQAFVNAVVLVACYDKFISGCSYDTAYLAYENYKNVLDSDPIQRGDVVFYGNVYENGQVGGPGHVAIYEGEVPGKEVISVWLPDKSVQRHALDPQGSPRLKRLGWMSPDKYINYNNNQSCR
jgi:hypothetical protein